MALVFISLRCTALVLASLCINGVYPLVPFSELPGLRLPGFDAIQSFTTHCQSLTPTLSIALWHQSFLSSNLHNQKAIPSNRISRSLTYLSPQEPKQLS